MSGALSNVSPLVWLGAVGIVALGVSTARASWAARGGLFSLSLIVLLSALGTALLVFCSPRYRTHPLGSRAQVQLMCIGSAIRVYMFDHEYQLPTTLGATFPYLDSASLYTVDGSGTPEPENAEDVDSGHCDFLYFGGGMHDRANTDEGVLATTKPSIFESRGYVCVLQGGHVETYKTVPEPVKALWKAYPNGKPPEATAPDKSVRSD
jgi:hypothetical protein